ncbi:MAG: transposase [Patescibacteria group bacterium]|jgi:putative transposase
MIKENKFKKHIPFHLYLDNQTYFVAARTFDKKKYFNSKEKLILLVNRLEQARRKFKITLHAWVALPNHYHILFALGKGTELSKIIKFINGGSSYDINKLDNTPGHKIWWNYWDRCIHEEKDFFKRFNYIHHNPVKHGYAAANGNYMFSSYNYYKNKLGKEFLNNTEYYYPIIDYTGVHGKFDKTKVL